MHQLSKTDEVNSSRTVLRVVECSMFYFFFPFSSLSVTEWVKANSPLSLHTPWTFVWFFDYVSVYMHKYICIYFSRMDFTLLPLHTLINMIHSATVPVPFFHYLSPFFWLFFFFAAGKATIGVNENNGERSFHSGNITLEAGMRWRRGEHSFSNVLGPWSHPDEKVH